MNSTSLYVHIPFCKSKCIYCDFLSYSGKEEEVKDYIHGLLREIEIKKPLIKEKTIKTIYIGGGTPTYIDSIHISEIMDHLRRNFNLDQKAEITIEANPGTLDIRKAESYRAAGINRASLGLQCTQDRLLKKIGRIHTFREFEDSFRILRAVGFDNINVDLMGGLPGQTLEDYMESLEIVAGFDPEHISSYGLIPEEGTPLMEMIKTGDFKLDEDLERTMYDYLLNFIKSRGYLHYEISNFARKGYESKHNLVYWSLEEYIGLGLGAHSFAGNKRFNNTTDMKRYIDLNFGGLDSSENFIELSSKELKEEFMFLGLRKMEGISVLEYQRKFGNDINEDYGQEISEIKGKMLIEQSGDRIRLTRTGLDFANSVFSAFIKD